MIEAKLAITDSELKTIRMAMKQLGTLNALCIYGYWNKDKCIGGAYLQSQFPNELVMEFYTHCPTIVKAIGQSYSGMLKLKPQLNAKIEITNYKSLKMVKMLGFVKLYTADNKIAVQFDAKNWRYKKRYPLELQL
ncbi:hypothetical protein UFOVP17_25 [uncultured Caudovirales phage]|uniref:Uncharacterized protein n=1 Tax=uncultured Caudovirales phage TaxID=2100421 RepID=A0A6J5KLV4_9CAUD|nr:hypothetical protein UFOVP17_25 [uncultured Caudovirales phage]